MRRPSTCGHPGQGATPNAPHTRRAKLARLTAQAWGEQAAQKQRRAPHTSQSTSALREVSPARRKLPPGHAPSPPPPTP